jgi:C-terminal processing protease CtpA/Prc
LQVKKDGKAAKQGVEIGDLVISINGCNIQQLTLNDSLKLLQNASEENSDGLTLELVRYAVHFCLFTDDGNSSRPRPVTVHTFMNHGALAARYSQSFEDEVL